MSQPRIAPVGPDLGEPLKSGMAKVFPLALPAPMLYRTVARNESVWIDLV